MEKQRYLCTFGGDYEDNQVQRSLGIVEKSLSTKGS